MTFKRLLKTRDKSGAVNYCNSLVHTKPNGFTIIELMLVLALLAIITTIAVPNFNQFIQRQSVKTQANNMQSALNAARAAALARNATIDVCWNFQNTAWAFPGSTSITDPDSGNAIGIAANSIAIAADTNPDELVDSVNLGSQGGVNLTSDADNDTRDCIAFSPQGFLVGGAANEVTFNIANLDDSEQLETVLSLTGRSIVKKPEQDES